MRESNCLKKFPILVENDNSTDDFPVNARDLWKQLGEPQGKFADWIKRKITKKIRIIKAIKREESSIENLWFFMYYALPVL